MFVLSPWDDLSNPTGNNVLMGDAVASTEVALARLLPLVAFAFGHALDEFAVGRSTLFRKAAVIIFTHMPQVDFSDEEYAAVTSAVRRSITEDKFPLSPRLAPLKSALAKLDPASVPKPLPERIPPPEAPMRSRGGRRARR